MHKLGAYRPTQNMAFQIRILADYEPYVVKGLMDACGHIEWDVLEDHKESIDVNVVIFMEQSTLAYTFLHECCQQNVVRFLHIFPKEG